MFRICLTIDYVSNLLHIIIFTFVHVSKDRIARTSNETNAPAIMNSLCI
jgi:hypothetical protein